MITYLFFFTSLFVCVGVTQSFGMEKKKHTKTETMHSEACKEPTHDIFEAIQNDCSTCLLANIKNKNKGEKNGMTPLQFAARRCRPALVEILLNKGAKINQSTEKEGWTALHIAVYHASGDVIFVGENGLSELEDCMEDSSEEHSYYQKSLELIKLLLAQGAGDALTVKDKNEQTALHIAAERGFRTIVKLFVEWAKLFGLNAFVTHKDNKGQSAYDLAVKKGFKVMAKLLEPFMSEQSMDDEAEESDE